MMTLDAQPASQLLVDMQARGKSVPARVARRQVRERLAGRCDEEMIDAVVSVVQELIVNALTHAPVETVRLTMELRTGNIVRVNVWDGNPELPAREVIEPGSEEESGRGLLMATVLASRVGFHREDCGKRMWAEFDVGEQS